MSATLGLVHAGSSLFETAGVRAQQLLPAKDKKTGGNVFSTVLAEKNRCRRET